MSRLTMHLESMSANSNHSSCAPRFRPLDEATIDLKFPHRLFVPEHYEPSYDYPLVVWLHSDASSEFELDNIMMAMSSRNYAAIAPRAQKKSRGSGERYCWGFSTSEIEAAEDMVWDSIQSVSNGLSINSNKIFLAGFGAGGTMAQSIGLKYARQIAGVVSLNGFFPDTPQVLSNWKQSRRLPVLFGQRQGSTLCNDDELLRAVRTSHRAGLGYRFFQMRDGEDISEANDLDSGMLDAANRFMMGIVTNTELSLLPEETCDNECIEFGFN